MCKQFSDYSGLYPQEKDVNHHLIDVRLNSDGIINNNVQAQMPQAMDTTVYLSLPCVRQVTSLIARSMIAARDEGEYNRKWKVIKRIMTGMKYFLTIAINSGLIPLECVLNPDNQCGWLFAISKPLLVFNLLLLFLHLLLLLSY